MRAVVDTNLCVGHARCEAVAPQVYQTSAEDGNLHAMDGEIPPELEQLALRGARACPERAIAVLGGAAGGERLWPPSPR
jgi:ferredoxin